VANIRAQSHDAVARTKAPAQETMFVQLLKPLCVVHVGLSARHILHVTRIHKEDFETARLEDLEDRDPVHAGRFHCDGLDAEANEPVGHRVQIAAEAFECTDRLVVEIGAHGHDMECGSDVEPCGAVIDPALFTERRTNGGVKKADVPRKCA
jgi:hypothetical protein